MTNRDQIVRDLIKDEYFHKLIIDPDQECIDFWNNWENELFERKDCVNKAKAVLLAFKFEADSISHTKKNKLWDSISDQIEIASLIKKRQQKDTSRQLWYGIAAAVTLLMIVFFTYNRVRVGHNEITESKIVLMEKEVPKGKISSLEFEDGTIVKLFSGSIIKYPKKFSRHIREVYLEGEGFFEVAKDTNRPFIVKTNNLRTTALGTSFNVRTFKNINKCNVSLVTGKVKVERLDKLSDVVNEVILLPGEEVVFVNEGVDKKQFNMEEVVSWKDGYIYLENKSFEESLEILERWFEIDFEVKNIRKAKGKIGTGKFRNQSLKNILQIMGYSFDFSFEINDKKVIINL